MVIFDETYLMVRNLLGEELYARLVGMLPDEYFNLPDSSKRIAFRAVLHEINHEGETDPAKLLEIVKNYTKMILEDSRV